MIDTNWYVLTGGPSSGKPTTIEQLAARGFRTTIEYARHYLDTQRQQGKTVEEVRSNQQEFQKAVLAMQIRQESLLPPGEVIFLDRALPDALAYYKFLKLPVDDMLIGVLRKFRYKKIFILELLPLTNDYARSEDSAAQKRIHQLITDAYTSLGFTIIPVPVMSPEDRVDFILGRL